MTQVYDDKELIANARLKAPDVKESYECGWEENAGMPNIWLPEEVLPGFKEACMDFYWVRGSLRGPMTSWVANIQFLDLP